MPTKTKITILLCVLALTSACGLTTLPTSSSPAAPPAETTEAQPEPNSSQADPASADDFELAVIATGLDQPWEITYGPDEYLWLTERVGKRILRVNPADGQISTIATVDEAYANLSQEGLLGLVLHPELLRGTDNDFVYVSFTYGLEFDSEDNPTETRAKIRRYRYDSASDQLIEPTDLLADLPAKTDHNGARLTLGPDDKLYYPIGDQGAGNFTAPCEPNLAQKLPSTEEITNQDWQHYAGKILRLNFDGSIPEDNPLWDGVQSHVYSIGHRNPQGLTAGNGQLFASEHGPKSDDEVNRIVGGRNYGWPHVSGYQDDQAYVYAEWSASTIPCEDVEFSEYQIPDEVPQHQESEWQNSAFMPPLTTFGTVSNNYNFQNPACEPRFFICWPTTAPTGIDFYDASRYADSGNGILGWDNSLLVAALKTGTVYRLSLNDGGDAVMGEPQHLFQTINRYRDLAIAPDGRTFYVATDKAGLAQDESGMPTQELAHLGAILAFRYMGD